ncbi:transcription antitermination factor NusB [Microscilla marina]|nr:transcription antitermination factor NusB [Microscilla marina]
MLNRRYLRIKVMQGLYALEHSRNANYLLSLDLIEKQFDTRFSQLAEDEKQVGWIFEKNHQRKPENIQIGKKLPEKVRQLALDILDAYWNSDEQEALQEQKFAPLLQQVRASYKEDNDALTEEKKNIMAVFKEVYEQEQPTIDVDASDVSKKTLVKAIDIYHNKLQEDVKNLEARLLQQSRIIYTNYLIGLIWVTEIAELVNLEKAAKASSLLKAPIFEGDYKMGQNVVCQTLKNSDALKLAKEQRKIDDAVLRTTVRELYKKVIKEDEEYINYQKLGQNNAEDDKKIVNHILKNIIFKHEITNSYFEELDLSWSENRKVVQSMAVKTIKAIMGDTEEEDGDAEETEITINKNFELSPLSKNWDEDVVFYKNLYNFNVEGNQRYEDIIAKKTKNWDIERLALIDKVILKMAICEMINFYSIPVKVTINEYIELAKTYSTPKSKKFVNGLLDSIAQDLIEQGDIKKSGRGLMDNK